MANVTVLICSIGADDKDFNITLPYNATGKDLRDAVYRVTGNHQGYFVVPTKRRLMVYEQVRDCEMLRMMATKMPKIIFWFDKYAICPDDCFGHKNLLVKN